LEIKLIQDTSNQIEEAYAKTSSLVRYKEYKFKQIAKSAFADTANLRKRWNAIDEKVSQEGAALYLFRNDTMVFWNSNQTEVSRFFKVLEPGLHFLNTKSGSYLVHFEKLGLHQLILLYPIKFNYQYQNQYIQNHFNDELSFIGNALLSPSKLTDFKDIQDTKGNYLFSIQIFGAENATSNWLKLLFVLVIGICIVCFHQLLRMSIKQYLLLSSIGFFALTITARMVFLGLRIPVFLYNLPLFNPEIYASSKLIPSLGDFLTLVFILLWYLWLIRDVNFKRIQSKNLKVIYLFMFSWLCMTSADAAVDAMKSLVFDSQISFDINNIFALNQFTFIGLLLAFLILVLAYQISKMFYRFLVFVDLNNSVKFLAVGMVFFFVHPYFVIYLYERNAYFPIGSLLLIGSFFSLKHFVFKRINRLKKYMSLVLIFSVFTSCFIYYWSYKEEQLNQVLFAGKLTAQQDINTLYFLSSAEKKIAKDPFFRKYLENNASLKSQLIKYIRPLYFNAYLSKYDITVYDFDSLGNSFSSRNAFTYHQLNYVWESESAQSSQSYFKFLSSNASIKGYLGKFPIAINGKFKGVLFVHLEPKLIQEENRFEELLVEGFQSKGVKKRSEYSFAIYRDRQLLSQSGRYAYRTAFTFPDLHIGTYQFVTENGFDHLVLRESEQVFVVVSKIASTWYEPFGLFSLSFTFFTILLIAAIFLFILINNPLIEKIPFLNTFFVNKLRPLLNRVLFFDKADLSLLRSRIQLGIIIIVFVTLASTAYFTIDLIKNQNNSQQTEKLLKKIRSVASAIETEASYQNLSSKNPNELRAFLNQISDFYETEISLFEPSGVLLSSTYSKLFDDQVLAPYIHSEAYYQLNLLKSSLFIQNEKIANFSYVAAYVPIHGKDRKAIGFIQLPYFNKYADMYSEISSIVVGSINLYALLFIIIGIIAWVYSRNITLPLLLIQKQMSAVAIGKKNDTITWSRKDEIGELVAQYNKMIEQLEESVQKLAASEREGAWRDIAKQIAHEIKNPLTPMKLSIQHLERAWNDQSPKLPETFKKVTQTLITQIDSLSELATGFSSFAKMPLPNYEQIQLHELVSQIVALNAHQFDGVIQFDIPETIHVEFDKGYLNRILVNLIKNAMQAIPEDKKGNIFIRAKATHETVTIALQDNGSGISTAQIEKIFTPYFSTKTVGMGLGLPIVKSMIESGGGHIYFETEEGKGTTFTIELPLQRNA